MFIGQQALPEHHGVTLQSEVEDVWSTLATMSFHLDAQLLKVQRPVSHLIQDSHHTKRLMRSVQFLQKTLQGCFEVVQRLCLGESVSGELIWPCCWSTSSWEWPLLKNCTVADDSPDRAATVAVNAKTVKFLLEDAALFNCRYRSRPCKDTPCFTNSVKTYATSSTVADPPVCTSQWLSARMSAKPCAMAATMWSRGRITLSNWCAAKQRFLGQQNFAWSAPSSRTTMGCLCSRAIDLRCQYRVRSWYWLSMWRCQRDRCFSLDLMSWASCRINALCLRHTVQQRWVKPLRIFIM